MIFWPELFSRESDVIAPKTNVCGEEGPTHKPATLPPCLSGEMFAERKFKADRKLDSVLNKLRYPEPFFQSSELKTIWGPLINLHTSDRCETKTVWMLHLEI